MYVIEKGAPMWAKLPIKEISVLSSDDDTSEPYTIIAKLRDI